MTTMTCETCGAHQEVRRLHRLNEPGHVRFLCIPCLEAGAIRQFLDPEKALQFERGLPLSGYEAWGIDDTAVLLRRREPTAGAY